MSDSLVLLCGGCSKNAAEQICVYLTKQYMLAEDGKIVARQTTSEDPSFYPQGENNWIIEFPSNGDYWKQFSITLNNMRNSASDFLNGWKTAVRFVQEQPITKKSKHSKKHSTV